MGYMIVLRYFLMVFAFCLTLNGLGQSINPKMKKWGEGKGMTNVESVVFDAQTTVSMSLMVKILHQGQTDIFQSLIRMVSWNNSNGLKV